MPGQTDGAKFEDRFFTLSFRASRSAREGARGTPRVFAQTMPMQGIFSILSSSDGDEMQR